ncbi:MAG: NUDIX pyrophosphatase [Chloroflexi bacterium HGW-Chloroflexi-3]|nr:MAG: NUDIX pyrophosphatase [Chloroflexi bacterium HGW-Chloroflexi-3]
MPRAPFQVLVFPYRKNLQNQFEFALLLRADEGFWQGIAGGGEDDETPLEAARRETFEETGIGTTSTFIQLDTIESVPVTEFKDSSIWGEDVYVIPQYCFGVSTSQFDINISDEHSAYGWFLYEQAHQILKFDGNKTALWELNQRLKKKGPRG